MKKILIVASEPAPGMIPFVVSIYNIIEKSKEVKPVLLMQNREFNDFRKHFSLNQNIFFVDFPKNFLLRCINKFIPYRLINAINTIKKKEYIDDLHLITGDFSLWIYVLMHLRGRKNFYYTVHDLIPHETYKKQSFLKNLFNKYLYFAEKVIRNISCNLMTCSIDQYNNLHNRYPKKKINFVHFPSLINNAIIEGSEKITELKNESNYILFFGRVDYYKGIDLLVDAYLKLNVTCKLVIAGSGVSQYTNDNRIIRINRFIKDEEINDLFSKADIVVFPYRNATMSGVFSLPMFFQKKIVASNINFFMQYKDADIYYFESCNVDSLAETICKSLKDKVPHYNYSKFYSESLIKKEIENFYL